LGTRPRDSRTTGSRRNPPAEAIIRRAHHMDKPA